MRAACLRYKHANCIAILHAAHHGWEKRVEKDGTELDDRKDGEPETELDIVQAIPHLHKLQGGAGEAGAPDVCDDADAESGDERGGGGEVRLATMPDAPK